MENALSNYDKKENGEIDSAGQKVASYHHWFDKLRLWTCPYLFDDGSVGFDGGGANLIPPGGGGKAPVAPVRVRLVDSLPSFFWKSISISILLHCTVHISYML